MLHLLHLLDEENVSEEANLQGPLEPAGRSQCQEHPKHAPIGTLGAATGYHGPKIWGWGEGLFLRQVHPLVTPNGLEGPFCALSILREQGSRSDVVRGTWCKLLL